MGNYPFDRANQPEHGVQAGVAGRQIKGNPLTQRIRGVRQVISDTNGVLLPEIRIRENFRLKPTQYAIFINGIKADEADIPSDKLMALPSSETYGEIDGVLGHDPAYGMPVTWIVPAQKPKR